MTDRSKIISALFGILSRSGKRVAVPVYLELMTHPDIGVVGEAANAIPACASAMRGCIRLLKKSYPETTRRFAAFALGNIGDTRAVVPLLDILESKDDSPIVRGHAAEAVGLLLMVIGICKRPVRKIAPGVRRCATRALMNCLNDPSTEVRFWSCYALGSMQAKSALELLDRLAKNDRCRVSGFWTVGREARDAARCIRQGAWPA